ncbi:hypothetical protein F5Y04DRAFT_282065 [Hypomontagnella monticulosa]|nr:hypothetical protein F5Y04DRAFT_282065 [Hypomontagnella monticulosa]
MAEADASNVYWYPDNGNRFWAQGPVDLGTCWPTGYLGQATEYYSPGLCPSGFAPACSRINSIGSVTETIQTCCPTNHQYTCLTQGDSGWGGGACFSDLGTGTWTLTSVYVITDNDATSFVGASTGSIGAVNARGVQVRFQSTDFMTTTPTNTISSQSTTTSSLTSTNTSPSETSGLSTGAQAGIGVGVAVGVLALLAIAGFIFLKRRKATTSRQDLPELHGRTKPPAGPNYTEMIPLNAHHNTEYTAPVPQRSPVEMGADQTTYHR